MVVIASSGFHARVSVDCDRDDGGVAVVDGDSSQSGVAGGVFMGAWA